MQINKFIFIGLPQSGKSTYLAAFWYSALSDKTNKLLKINKLKSNFEYLNKLQDAWIKCEPVDRTKLSGSQLINLNIIDHSTKNETDLVIPDEFGEMYELQFQTRKLDKTYADLLEGSNGIALFIHPIINEHKMIIEADDIIGSTQQDNTKNEVSKALKNEESKNNITKKLANNITEIKWDFKYVPTQTILTELLQFANEYRTKPNKLVIIISAWDIVINTDKITGDTTTPEYWLQLHLPFLYQYINSNYKENQFEVFGISAQGNEYNDENKANLFSFTNPIERIIVQQNDSVSNDITLPIKWLLNE